MKVGLQLATFTWPGGPAEIARRLREIARTAEHAGFYSLWVMDHYFQIPPWGKPEDHPMLEAYTTLGYIAAATERIKLGVMVAGVVYRPPAVLIKAATTVDVLSGGRTYFGVGAAWYRSEAVALGIPFPDLSERYALLQDTLRLARRTWSGDTKAFEGHAIHAAYPLSNPRPLSSPRPKIMIGGDGPKRTLALVARYADAWNVITSPAGIDTHRERLRAHCDRLGRSIEEIEITALDPDDLRVEEDPGYRWSVAYERARLEAWREKAVDHVIVNMADPFDLEKLRRFGSDVIRLLS